MEGWEWDGGRGGQKEKGGVFLRLIFRESAFLKKTEWRDRWEFLGWEWRDGRWKAAGSWQGLIHPQVTRTAEYAAQTARESREYGLPAVQRRKMWLASLLNSTIQADDVVDYENAERSQQVGPGDGTGEQL